MLCNLILKLCGISRSSAILGSDSPQSNNRKDHSLWVTPFIPRERPNVKHAIAGYLRLPRPTSAPALMRVPFLTWFTSTLDKISLFVAEIIFVVAEITFNAAVITSSVTKIIFVRAEIPFKVSVSTYPVAKITFAAAKVTFKVAVMTSSVTEVNFCSGCDNF